MTLLMPQNPILEAEILAWILNKPEVSSDLILTLTDQDFHCPKNKVIFNSCRAVFAKSKTTDFYLVLSHIKENGELKSCGGTENLMAICNRLSNSMDYNYYAAVLRNLTSLRKLIHASLEITKMAAQPDANCEEVIQNLFSSVYSIQGITNSKTHKLEDIFKTYSEHGNFEETVDWMRQRVNQGLTPYTGVECNYPILDRILGFFRPGCIYYIGARTSMGKTTFMLNLIRGMFKTGKKIPVGIFSLEMPAPIITAKLLCMMADVKFSSYEDMKIYPEEIQRIKEQAEFMRELPIFIEDQEDLTISKLRTRARRLVQTHGVKIIYIDYLTRIKSDTKYSSKHLQVDEISKGLQSMAKELNVPVICLAQLNRATEGKQDQMPSLSNFRESGSIEEDCDAALLIHRPDYYNANNCPGQVQVIVAKNRLRGQLKKISFGKSATSEVYEELEEIGDVVHRCNSRLESPEPAVYEG